MLQRFLAHIEQHQLCTPPQRILLAVSGGMDSMTMLHLFRMAGYSGLGVAHANFGLRGNESDNDERFVQDYCARHHLPFYNRRFDTKNYAQQNGISIQMAARELRYAWFDELLEKENFSAIATAHTLTDSAETFLMNFLHGASAESLAGIPVKHHAIIRPLLFATRKEVEAYAKAQGIHWREDSSNASDAYMRNYLRHHVLPHFEHLNPSWEENAARSMEKLMGTLHLQQWVLGMLREKFFLSKQQDIILSKEIFREHFHPYILYKLIEPYGFNYATCGNILKAIHEQPGKKFLGSSHQLTVDRDALIISPHQGSPEEVLIEEGQQQVTMGKMQLTFSPANVNERPAQPVAAILDAAKLEYPLRWRTWKPGDYFYPLGMHHRKKISDFLIDNKISLPEKKRITVLESAGQIAWVVGYRIDDRFKITPQTTRAIRLTLNPYFS
jgi:tRNA(Ile)-lysidine synthase